MPEEMIAMETEATPSASTPQTPAHIPIPSHSSLPGGQYLRDEPVRTGLPLVCTYNKS